jgi:hypothetical protein
MQTIDLAYVERGVHEELVAQVADQEGYYEDEGVHVAIHNGIGWDPERLRRGASIGLGRALLHRLTGGIGWKVLSVNTHRPLFWFVGNADVTSMADLRGRRVAVHPGQTAPGWFTRIVLREHGLDPDRDLECVVRLPVNYQMDLRRLRDGSIDAACVGTTFSPEQVAEEEGFHVLAWVGDHIQIPTVGVAVDPVHIPLDRVHRDAHGGDLDVIADPGQHVKPFFLGNLFGGERGADTGGVDRAVLKATQVHLVVTRMPHHTFQVAVGVQAVLAQDDPGETPRGE